MRTEKDENKMRHLRLYRERSGVVMRGEEHRISGRKGMREDEVGMRRGG
jgi:hypothetical protein